MRPISNVFLSLCLAIAVGTLATVPVRAAEKSSKLTVIPAVVDVGGKEGTEVPISFQLINDSELVLPIHMTTRDAQVRNGQTPELVKALSAKDWVKFKEADFILQPKQEKSVEATLYIPKDTASGGHYADLIVQQLSLAREDGIVATQPEIAVQMLITVVGNTREDLATALNGPSTVITNNTESKEFEFKVKNNGNIHTLFVPRLSIRKAEKNVEQVELPPQIILPSELKVMTFRLPKGLHNGTYTVQAGATYASPSKNANSPEISLIVLPFNALFLLLIPVVAIGAYGYRIRSRIYSALKIILEGSKK